MRRLLLAIAALVAIPALAFGAITQIATAAVTVGTTATALRTSLKLDYARHVLVCVPGTATASVWVGNGPVTGGPPTVTTGTGTELEPGDCYSTGERLAAGVALYAITASGTVSVRVTESY